MISNHAVHYSPKGQWGCYFVPLSTGLRSRRCGTSIRTISLTATGFSTNEVLDFIIPDLLKGATEGFKTYDAAGEKVLMFIKVIGFKGDYPEASKVLGVLIHSARTPCTVCTFRHLTAITLSRFGYSTLIHSLNSGFGRSFRKCLSLRSCNLSTKSVKYFGMVQGSIGDIDEFRRWPLFKLACALDAVRASVSLTKDEKPVINVDFDPYSRNFVAPDHLLAEIGKYLLEFIFLTITSAQTRSKLDLLLFIYLKRLGLGIHASLFNPQRHVLNFISMSTVYALLTVILPHLNTVQSDVDAELLDITRIFTELVYLTL